MHAKRAEMKQHMADMAIQKRSPAHAFMSINASNSSHICLIPPGVKVKEVLIISDKECELTFSIENRSVTIRLEEKTLTKYKPEIELSGAVSLFTNNDAVCGITLVLESAGE